MRACVIFWEKKKNQNYCFQFLQNKLSMVKNNNNNKEKNPNYEDHIFSFIKMKYTWKLRMIEIEKLNFVVKPSYSL